MRRLSSGLMACLLVAVILPVQASVPADIVQEPATSSLLSSASYSETLPTAPVADNAQAEVTAALRSSPVMFIENVGQFAEGARFQVWGGPGTMWLAEDAIWITVVEPMPEEQGDPERLTPGAELIETTPRDAVHLKLSFVDANPHPQLEPFDRQDTHVSYFIGADPDKWHADVPVWGGVRYLDLYPGLDLEVSGASGHIEQRLIVRDEAIAENSLEQVRLQVTGANGVSLSGGHLHLVTLAGKFTISLLTEGLDADKLDKQPSAVAIGDGLTFTISVPFAHSMSDLESTGVEAQSSDVLYATFLGGSDYDGVGSVAVDSAGQAYLAGSTMSPDFPAALGPGYDPIFDGGYRDDNYYNGDDAFVVKLNAAGTALVYATFLGGWGDDSIRGIALDGAGQVYVAGCTTAADSPAAVGPGYDTHFDGPYDGFVAKLNASGTALLYATFLGGTGYYDFVYGIAVDGAGHAFVTGWTSSADFPAVLGPGYDTEFAPWREAFAVKFDASGTALLYATFLGGGGDDYGTDIAVDGAGQAYVTGHTYSSDFPSTLGPGYDTQFHGHEDAFVVKLNATGTALLYATFLGGGGSSWANAIAVDGAGQAYVTGCTTSAEFPAVVEPGYDSQRDGPYDAFLVKLNTTGTTLLYATYLGGSGEEAGYGVTTDGVGQAYVTGYTTSADFPATIGPGYDTLFHGGTPYGEDGFMVKFNAAGTALAYATFLGGAGDDSSGGIAVDQEDRAYVTGSTASADFPAALGPGYDTTYNGGYEEFTSRDGFVMKLATTGIRPSLRLPFDPAENGIAPAKETQRTHTGLHWLTSYFDHQYPTYDADGNSVLRLFTGQVISDNISVETCAPVTHCYDGHDGYDFGLEKGKPVRAAADGVASYQYDWYLGHTIIVRHPGNYYTRYCHLEWTDLCVTTSGITTTVNAGEIVGLVGNSGTTDAHLHFIVYHDVDVDGILEWNEKVDPYGYNPKLPDPDPWPTSGGGVESSWLWAYPLPDDFYIDPDGGTAVSGDNGFSVQIPAGAVSAPINIYLSLGTDPESGASATLNLRSYSATATDAGGNPVTSFLQPLTLTMPYGDVDVQYAQESSLTIHWWDELNQVWQPLTTVVDVVNRTVSAVTSHFSLFSLRGAPVYPAPGVQEVGPNVLWNDIDRTLTITGTGFVEGAQISIGQSRLATEFATTTTLNALVADGLVPGTYDVTVTNPDGQSGTVNNAIAIVQAASTPLVPGWNLVSIPIQPQSTTITEALSSISGSYDLVYAYDTEDPTDTWRKYSSAAPVWANDLADVNESMGVWIHATDSVTLGLTGTKILTTTIPLTTGWNLVGYPCLDTRPITAALSSIEGLYTQVYAYDAAQPEIPWQSLDTSMPSYAWTLTEMAAGRGYWIKATEPCTLTISNP